MPMMTGYRLRAVPAQVSDNDGLLKPHRQNPIPDVVQFHPEALDEDAYAKVTKMLAAITGPRERPRTGEGRSGEYR
jgi:hypothetical protein